MTSDQDHSDGMMQHKQADGTDLSSDGSALYIFIPSI